LVMGFTVYCDMEMEPGAAWSLKNTNFSSFSGICLKTELVNIEVTLDTQDS